MRLSVGFVSLGCPKNLADTERMIGLLSGAGFTITGDQSQADVAVINTCGFLEAAKNESLSTIQEFVDSKKAGSLRGLIVAGCMTERYLQLMADKFPEVDAFIQVRDFSKILETMESIQAGDAETLRRRRALIGELSQLEGHSELPDFEKRAPGIRPYAYVKIAEGCNRTCSFCIIPKLRGKLHSRSIQGIVDEVRQLASFGTKEIILIAQDLTSYGRDRDDSASLLRLMEQIESVEGIEWIRLNYNYPRFFSDDLIDFLANSKRFSKYLDIPFQHSSDAVLKRMRRPESAFEIRSLIEKLRAKMPDISLRTTLMVGFPGETEEDFQDLLSFLKWAKLENVGAFKYCREEGTPSYDLPDQISEDVKDRRYAELMGLQKKLQKKRLGEIVGSTRLVMVDSFMETTKQGHIFRGRHSGQAPEIDGVCYIVSDERLAVGSIIPVAIQKIIGDYDLLGVPNAEVAELVHKSSGGAFVSYGLPSGR